MGKSEQNYNYFLLPKRIAEVSQGDRRGLSQRVFFEWIVPQWFFQNYDGVPEQQLWLSILVDEHGRERKTRSARAPWQDLIEIEEEPHAAIALEASCTRSRVDGMS